jgi:nicotinate phosphoribosyltransferase
MTLLTQNRLTQNFPANFDLAAFDPNDRPYFEYLGPLAADKYAYTMAAAAFEAERCGAVHGLFDSQTTFQMFVRQLPKTGQQLADGTLVRSPYLVSAGDLPLASWLSGWRFSNRDLGVLAEELTPAGGRLYSDEFLQRLKSDSLRLEIDSMADGELAFEREPIVRVTGPFYQCLMVEAMMLGIRNSCSNFATLAAQVTQAAEGRPVYEYGLRRAQDIGGLGPSYGAFIGGAAGTSNYLARKHFGIPASGTMAHALVMLGGDELEAFAIWAQGAPDVAVFLVDTYNTLDGVRNAIKTCQKFGIQLNGIRLDSGDLGYFAKEARKLLDAAGFDEAKIFASNDLDPAKIDQLLRNKAPIDYFAVGTWLAAAQANPALGGVYKLARAWDQTSLPRDVMKFSEERAKATLPGPTDVLRMIGDDGQWAGDVIVPLDADLGVDAATREIVSIDPLDDLRRKSFKRRSRIHRPVSRLWRDGRPTVDHMNVKAARAFGQSNLARLDPDHKRLLNAHRYVAGIEAGLHDSFTRRLAGNIQRPARPASLTL